MILYVSLLLLHLMLQSTITVHAQNVCPQPPCVRTSVQLSSNAAIAQGLPYACRGDELTFTCQVMNGAGLQWVNEPEICRSLPVGYTTANSEGNMEKGSSYQSYLISVVRNPPFSNFSSNLTFTANPPANNVTVQCGDQLSSCSNTEDEITVIITDIPVVTTEHLRVLPINDQESCPNVSIRIQVDEIQDIAPLTYTLNVSSSDGCVLPECPMLVSPGERVLNMTLLNGVNYTAMLTVSNDCGSNSTIVSFPAECVRATDRSPTGVPVNVIVGSAVGASLSIIVIVIIVIIILVWCFWAAKVRMKRRVQAEVIEESVREIQRLETILEKTQKEAREKITEKEREVRALKEKLTKKLQEARTKLKKKLQEAETILEKTQKEARTKLEEKLQEAQTKLEETEKEVQALKETHLKEAVEAAKAGVREEYVRKLQPLKEILEEKLQEAEAKLKETEQEACEIHQEEEEEAAMAEGVDVQARKETFERKVKEQKLKAELVKKQKEVQALKMLFQLSQQNPDSGLRELS